MSLADLNVGSKKKRKKNKIESRGDDRKSVINVKQSVAGKGKG